MDCETTITEAVRKNRPAVELTAVAIIAQIDAQIEHLHEMRNDEKNVEEVRLLMDWRNSIVWFPKLLSEGAPDKQIAREAQSIMKKFGRWSPDLNAEIRKQTFKFALYTSGLVFGHLIGVPTTITAVMLPVLIEPKHVSDVLKASTKFFNDKEDNDKDKPAS